MNRFPWIAGIGVALFLAAGSLAAQAPSPKDAPQAPAAAKAQSCSQTANTQMDLNECAGKGLRQAEARLAALLKRLRIDPNSPEEKAWEAYRDAQLKAIYPPVGNEQAEYGSVYPMCLATLKKKLTESRIRDLKMLTTTEGDACLGYRVGGNGK
jgi:uncharacterized protein YecT (DUF1311 family)